MSVRRKAAATKTRKDAARAEGPDDLGVCEPPLEAGEESGESAQGGSSPSEVGTDASSLEADRCDDDDDGSKPKPRSRSKPKPKQAAAPPEPSPPPPPPPDEPPEQPHEASEEEPAPPMRKRKTRSDKGKPRGRIVRVSEEDEKENVPPPRQQQPPKPRYSTPAERYSGFLIV